MVSLGAGALSTRHTGHARPEGRGISQREDREDRTIEIWTIWSGDTVRVTGDRKLVPVSIPKNARQFLVHRCEFQSGRGASEILCGLFRPNEIGKMDSHGTAPAVLAMACPLGPRTLERGSNGMISSFLPAGFATVDGMAGSAMPQHRRFEFVGKRAPSVHHIP